MQVRNCQIRSYGQNAAASDPVHSNLWRADRKLAAGSRRPCRFGKVTLTLCIFFYLFSLVQAETYLLACQRYIELNPVPAAMVEDPAHYRWTSYRTNGLGRPDGRVSPHSLYRALGHDDKARQAAFRALFRAQLDRAAIDDIRLALNQSRPLGNERFYAKIEKMTGVRREAKPRGRPRVDSELGGPAPAGQNELGL